MNTQAHCWRFRPQPAAVILACVCSWFLAAAAHAAPAAIPISKLERSSTVDFQSELLPVLKAKCLACHNQTRAKADLVLETPQTILKGSENGPVVLPGRSADSLLLQVASHRTKPSMPPRENKVEATDLTPDELGLLKLWIDQGAQGEVRQDAPIAWQPLPRIFNPIYAVAVTADGQYAACNRANRIYLYHLSAGQPALCLSDLHLPSNGGPSTEGLAHRDAVHALAFNPDGNLLASAGYREIKLWRRNKPTPRFESVPSTNELTAVTVSANGLLLATGDPHGRVRLSKLASGQSLGMVDAHEGPIRCLRFSPDGTRLLSAGAGDGLVRLWDVATAALLSEAYCGAAVTSLTWLDDGRQVASGTAEGMIYLWSAPSVASRALPRLKEFQASEAEISSLVALPGSTEELLSGDAQGALRVWDLESASVLREMHHGAPIITAAIAPDGKRIVSVGTDNVARLWAGESDRPIAQLQGDRYALERLAASERGLRLATNELAYCKSASETSEKERTAAVERVRKADTTLTAAEKSVSEAQKKSVETAAQNSVALKKLEELKASLAQAKATLEAEEFAAEQAQLELRECLGPLLNGNLPADVPMAVKELNQRSWAEHKPAIDSAIEAAAARARAAGVAKAQFEHTEAELKDRQKKAQEELTAATKQANEADAARKKAEQTRSNAETELTLAIAAAQKSADAASDAQNAIAAADSELKRATLQLAASKRASVEAESAIRAVAFTPDSRLIITAGDDRSVHTWNADSGQAVETFPAQSAPVWSLACNSSAQAVAAAADGASIGWKLDYSWALERTIGSEDATSPISDRVNALAFTPDGSILASGSGEPSRSGQIQLWDVRTGKLAQEFGTAHSDAVLALAFSPAGKYLASGAADRFMKVIDLESRKVFKAFEGHTHHVLGVAWKPDGRMLATAGADNVVKLWDFRTGERKKNVEGFNKEVTSICPFGDDQFLAVCGDHQVRLLNAKGDEVRAYSGADGFLEAAAATPDGKLVLAGGEESVLWVWNGATGERASALAPPVTSVAEQVNQQSK